MRLILRLLSTLAFMLGLGAPAFADLFFFTTGDADGRIGVASRPASADGSKIEIEAADDFILNTDTILYTAVFTGVMPPNFTISDLGNVKVEIYRVFPNDSDTTRASNVPTRTNSPGDVEFDSRSVADGTLVSSFEVVQFQYQVANSVVNGVSPQSGGDGPVSGWLTSFAVVFVEPLVLPADHYFFVPQVEVRNGLGDFLWASTPRDQPRFDGDLQQWIRNSNLDPDWLRVGTDIVGGTTFNGSFSLLGVTISQ